jgi:hypothetical protein
MFVLQFCDVATVANINKRKEPNLAIVKIGEKTFSRIPLCFGRPSNDEVNICESSMNRYVSHRCKILHCVCLASFPEYRNVLCLWMWPRQKNTIDMQIGRSFSHMLLWIYSGMHKLEHICVQFWTLQPPTDNNRSRVLEHYASTIKVVGPPLRNNIQEVDIWSACQVKTRNLNANTWTHHSHLMIVGSYLHFY